MINLILSILACAPSGATLDTNPTADTADTGNAPYTPDAVAPSHFTCDRYDGAVLAIPEGVVAISAVHLVDCDGAILGETDNWSIGPRNIAIVCAGACGGEVVWSPGE